MINMRKIYLPICLMIAMTLFFSDRGNAESFDVRFEMKSIEDKFAINTFPFVWVFRNLNIGYAGCLISLSAVYGDIEFTSRMNSDIVSDIEIYNFDNIKIEMQKIWDDILDKEISVYTNARCENIMMISMVNIGCFGGFQGQNNHLACPYNFKMEDQFVGILYDSEEKANKDDR